MCIARKRRLIKYRDRNKNSKQNKWFSKEKCNIKKYQQARR